MSSPLPGNPQPLPQTSRASHLIVFEGPEGAGKTTQLRRLAEWVERLGARVVTVREPGGTRTGDEIRRWLLDPASDITPRGEALLFMASRAELVEREICPALDRGTVVLVDRFFLSTYAYQAAGRGIAEEDIRAANRLATQGLTPGLTLLLRMPAQEGLARAAKRGEHDRMERADPSFHERVERAFDSFATEGWQEAHPECGPIVMIDATGSESLVHSRVVRALEARWPESFPMTLPAT